jgi:hypothetical protein
MTTIDELLVETQLSRHDFLELVAFERKVEFEGLSYAVENYTAQFEATTLVEDAYSTEAMGDLLDAHAVAIDRFWTEVPNPVQYVTSHIDTARNRDDRVAAGENPGGVDEERVPLPPDTAPDIP